MKSVLITGCSAGGIGASLCNEFEKRGFHVFAAARTVSKIGDVESWPNVTPLTLDVTSTSSIAAAVDVVRQKTDGQLDYLVNNAGSQYISTILDVDIEAAKAMYDVNVWGCVAMIQAFAPFVITVKGTIINIASITGYLSTPFMGKWLEL